MTLRRRLIVEWLGVAIIASLAIAALIWWQGLARFDNLLYDRLIAFAQTEAADDIVIVAIDEPSLQRFGKWPWSRERHAALFERLNVSGPKAVGFDILLSEPEGEADSALAAAMAQTPNLVVPLHFIFPGRNGAAFDPVRPIADIAGAADAIGHVNLNFDADGSVRRVNLCFGTENPDRQWPHLAEALYREIAGNPSRAFAGLRRCDQPLLLPFAEPGSFVTISYAALAAGEIPPTLVRDKTILIGATATGLGDRYPVALRGAGTMPGVEIIANMLGAISADRFITPMPFWAELALSLAPVWLLLIGFWIWRPQLAWVAALVLLMLVIATSAALLNLRLWFAPGPALAGLLLVYPLWGWRRLQATSRYLGEELQRFREGSVDIPVLERPLGPVDHVTGQVEELGHAISYTRDLGRFVRDALANLPDPMFLTGLDGRVRLINRMARVGSEEELIGLQLGQMLDRFVADEDRSTVQQYLNKALREGSSGYVEFTSRDGAIFAMRRAPVLSDSGALRGHIHYLADITALANAAREREEVLQLLSHDMRAPQAAILALLEDSDDDTADRVRANARQTLALADNFVDLARMDAGDFAGEELLLADIVAQAADSLYPLARKRDITLARDDRSDSAFILGEPSSLYRSFVNLLDNAIKYSPDGGTVHIEIRRIDIDKKPQVAVSIRDEGEGISDAVLERLFERFASDDSKSKGGVKGAGLGLNFVRAVVERHGGSVRAENHRQGGAIVTMLLPMIADEG